MTDTILIYSKDPNKMTDGLFGNIFLFMFEVVPILENNSIDISNLKWDITSKSYGPIFPTYLEYNSDYINPSEINNCVDLFDLRTKYSQFTLGDDFEKINKLFFKYFKIPKRITDISDRYDLSNYLGIHFRGTDKTTDVGMNTTITKNDFYIIIESFIKTNPEIENIYIATDENDVFDYLKNKYNTINFITSRDFHNNNLFWKTNNDLTRNGTEAMVDMLCLSKCKLVLKVSSALSGFSKLMNPNLNIYRLNAVKMFADIPYFPDAYIPLLEKNDKYSDECNSVLDKIQQNDWSKTHKEHFNNFYYKPR
jgi:hypothetical protein